MARQTTLTDWQDTVGGRKVAPSYAPVSLPRYAMLASYSALGASRVSGPSDTRELPETGTTVQPGATLHWTRRRRFILDARATVEVTRRERAYARGYIDGSDDEQHRRDAIARSQSGFGRYYHDR